MNRCQSMEQEIQDRADFLIGKLRDSYQRQAANLRAAAAATIDDVEASRYDLILTITDLPEPDAEDEDAEDYSKSKYCGEIWRFEDIQEGQVFPIGRSKSKKMIHQGVSLSKDDRVSTKHGIIELREGLELPQTVVELYHEATRAMLGRAGGDHGALEHVGRVDVEVHHVVEDEFRVQLEALGDRLDARRPERPLRVDEQRHALAAAVRRQVDRARRRGGHGAAICRADSTDAYLLLLLDDGTPLLFTPTSDRSALTPATAPFPSPPSLLPLFHPRPPTHAHPPA